MRVITNSNRVNDRMYKLIKDQSIDSDILIASAFFTNIDLLKEMIDNNCNVLLIVRLGRGTSPEALKEALHLKNVDIRFFTGTSFHPKFYIFGNRIAYIGSSNFTKKGLTSNQEINIEVDSEEQIFQDLNEVFLDYWDSAEVLTEEYVDKFIEIYKDYPEYDPSYKITEEIGDFLFDNVGRGKEFKDKHQKFILSFRKNYQRYITSFNFLKSIYEDLNLRRFQNVPLRIEVDRFLWWIREAKAKGDSFKNVPKKSNNEIRKKIEPLIREFIMYENNYLETEAVPRYHQIVNAFSNKNKINSCDINELINILTNVHAFNDTLKYSKGGLSSMKANFLSENGEQKIKKTISMLLFNSEEYITKIYKCIKLEEFKLVGFGENSVKELFGLVNDIDIPISNGRTLKSLEWLGFGKL